MYQHLSYQSMSWAQILTAYFTESVQPILLNRCLAVCKLMIISYIYILWSNKASGQSKAIPSIHQRL